MLKNLVVSFFMPKFARSNIKNNIAYTKTTTIILIYN